MFGAFGIRMHSKNKNPGRDKLMKKNGLRIPKLKNLLVGQDLFPRSPRIPTFGFD